MQNTLKQLNGHSSAALLEISDDELQRFEVLCENWHKLAEAERAYRKSLPGQVFQSAPNSPPKASPHERLAFQYPCSPAPNPRDLACP